MDKYDNLKLDNQLCFPLYAAAKEIVRKPLNTLLDDLNLPHAVHNHDGSNLGESANVKEELILTFYLDSEHSTPL